MSEHKLSRREFIKMAGIAASAAALGACTSPTTPNAPTVVVHTATSTSSPTPTAELTPTLEVIVEAGGIELVLVEAGSFQMGSTQGFSREQPVHTVTITKPFYIGKYEVTFEQYDAFCDATGKPKPDDAGWGRGNQPVISVNWYDALEYCNWLSEREGLSPCYTIEGLASECDFAANGYRLPTEAEWEYAARGGQRSQGYTYAGSDNPDDVAWYIENSDERAHPVGQKAPNELGLYDMSGNVGEWCWDWYNRDYYASAPSSDPPGPEIGRGIMGRQRIRRGGDFWNYADLLRTTARSFDTPQTRIAYEVSTHGFRIVRTAS